MGWSGGWLGGRGRIFGGHGKVMVVSYFILNSMFKFLNLALET
jgi:hypothetical protein